MTDPDQPQDFATIGRLAAYLQQLILLDTLAQAIEIQQKGVFFSDRVHRFITSQGTPKLC